MEKAAGEPSGKWEPSPYPGLSPFSQRDAAYFFGREEEVEALWTKLQERTLLGLIGPSGAGKSSLLRAGLVPACPDGWGVWLCQPRNDPFRGLEGLDAWRKEHTEALVVVDQFEELFTLNDEKTQERYAEHLPDLSRSGVHVLLSMRDDFLIRCHAYPSLEPVFKDLTPVLPLEGAALRKALVEPARASGYRFEDEALVAEILTEVSREKGALPLLAFAASKLWEKRDREGRRLTREAYLSIGGVGGALAQHAEETLSRIGLEREPVVREVFRNLVSGHGTRVPTTTQELLSVFPDRDTASEVLGKVVDARLLTSSEDEVEVIHESLLTAWPRLVRWQTQDADAAVFRDQLRQAARAWEERGRADDLLWTGISYRELGVFRERYAGGLTSAEKEFADASTRLFERTRRRRRIAVSVLVASLAIVAVVTSSLWRRSRAEALRAEAAKLLALGQFEIDEYPTAAVAYAIRSLELSDTEEARRFALRALQVGPPATPAPVHRKGTHICTVAFSDHGKLVAAAPDFGPTAEKVVRGWNLETGDLRVLGPVTGAGEGYAGAITGLTFLDPDHLLAGSFPAGLVTFDLREGREKLVADRPMVLGALRRNPMVGVGTHTTSQVRASTPTVSSTGGGGCHSSRDLA